MIKKKMFLLTSFFDYLLANQRADSSWGEVDVWVLSEVRS